MSMPPAIANTFLFEMMKSKSKDVTLAAIYALGEGRCQAENITRELHRLSQSDDMEIGFAPIFPDTCYHLTHYWLAAVDIPVASDNPVHYADAIRYNARTPLQGSLLPLTRLVWA